MNLNTMTLLDYPVIHSMVVYNVKNGQKLVLSVIIPAYNEERTILEVIERVQKVGRAKGYDLDIVVVDDGSIDNTPNLLKSRRDIRVTRHKSNQGKGVALQTGFRLATGKIIVIQDADLELLPENIPTLVDPVAKGNFDVVFGSRFLIKENESRMDGTHKLGNTVLNTFATVLYGKRITDVMTGYKCFKHETLEGFHVKSPGFEVEIELTVHFLKKGLRILEVPVHFLKREFGTAKISLFDGFRCLFKLISLRILSR